MYHNPLYHIDLLFVQSDLGLFNMSIDLLNTIQQDAVFFPIVKINCVLFIVTSYNWTHPSN